MQQASQLSASPLAASQLSASQKPVLCVVPPAQPAGSIQPADYQSAQQTAKRLQHLVNNLPTGIVVLDKRGYVAEANPVAILMLGEPLIGQRWLDIINRSFRPRSDDGLEVSLQDGRRSRKPAS